MDLGGSFSEVGTVGPSINIFEWGTGSSNYECRVRAFNAAGYSGYSNTVTIHLTYMALTLIKEDGTGKVDANSYADVADGDAHFEGHLYPIPWATTAMDRKAQALVMATRLIDAQLQFNGWRSNDGQALQWPRDHCPDLDRGLSIAIVLRLRGANFVDFDVVPKAIVDATCEMARELLIVDRTAAPAGEGVLTTTTGAGATFNSIRYSKVDTRPVISHVSEAMLAKYGSLMSGGSGDVRLVRS